MGGRRTSELAFAGWVVLSTLLLVPICALGQGSTGTILGVVTDPQGGVVPGASVSARNIDTNLMRSVPTETDGSYRMPDLPVGNYEVTVVKGGFQTNKREGLVLQVGQEAVVNVSLAVGSTSQTVEVNEQLPLVNTTASSVGTVVNEQSVANLPLNGRNWSALNLLQPGISQQEIPAFAAGGGTGAGAVNVFNMNGTWWSSNGASVHSNLILEDGAILNNAFGQSSSSAIGTTLGLDGIQEYRILTSSFSAEYGMVSGSQTTIVSKGGSNSFHGSAFEYLRNSAMDARNHFDVINPDTGTSLPYPGKRLPPFERNNFGGSFGGPIKKDKTFFFMTYEGLREGLGLTLLDQSLPLACFYGSNISAAAATSSTALFSKVPAFVNNNAATNPTGTVCAAGSPSTISVANGTNPQGQYTGTLGLADLFPQPNISGFSGFNYTFPYKSPQNEEYGQLRLDHSFSGKDSAFLRYTQDYSTETLPNVFLPETNIIRSDGFYLTAAETHLFSTNALNTARFALSNASENFFSGPTGDNSLIGPTISLAAGKDVGHLILVGTSGFGPNDTPGNFRTRTYTVSDDFFLTKGKHALKFGTSIVHYYDPSYAPGEPRGLPIFVSVGTFLSADYYSYKVGTPFQFQNGAFTNTPNDPYRNFSWDYVGVYVQDDYRVSRRLTLNLGLRYEPGTVPTGYNIRNQATDDFSTYGPLFSNASLHNFSPRLGFAWDVFGTGRTAVRGGGGILYDVANFNAGLLGSNTFAQMTLTPLSTATNAVLSPTPPIPWTVPLTIPSTPLQSLTFDGRSFDPHGHQPTTAEYNLAIQQQLPANIALNIGYVGSRSWHQWDDLEGDPTIPLGIDANGLPYYPTNSVGLFPAQFDSLIPTTAIPPQSLTAACFAVKTAGLVLPAGCKPNPLLDQSGGFLQTNGVANYNALQVLAERRLSHGLEVQASYTWSKELDDGETEVYGSEGTANNETPYNSHTNYGPGDFDIRNNFRLNGLYHAPSPDSTRAVGKALGGWWFAAIFSAQSGYPLTPTVDQSFQNNATTSDFPTRDPSYNAGKVVTGNPNDWFNVTMFDLPPLGHMGTAGRGIFTGPGLQDLDFSINKDTKLAFLGEAGVLQFRAEIFNIMNHANFSAPNTELSGSPEAPGQISTNPAAPTAALPTAGTITSTNTPSRQVQLSLRVIF
jgi:hypothetical protein